MTAIGHNAATQAVIEHMTRRASHTREVRSEHLPDDVRQSIAIIAAKLDQVIATQKDLEARLIAVEAVALPLRDEIMKARVA